VISEHEESEGMDGYERRRRATRRRILEAARALFFDRGPTRTTVGEIAGEAGVSPVTIYNDFVGKHALLEIVVREHLESSLARAEAVLDLEIPFEEKLERFFALGEDAGDQPSEESLAGWDWSDEGIRTIYEAFVADRQVPFLKRFVEMGKAEGAIRSDLSTEAVLVYFEANMTIYRDEALLSKGKEYLSSLSHLFFYGLLGR
jgi:AcrR family transcriptional regulator